jgi:hypothetical protein
MVNFNIRPMPFQVFRNKTAVARVQPFFAAKQAATIQNLMRGGAFDVSRPDQF